MPDRRNDPFDALHDPVSPRTPDPSFAAALRERLLRAVAASSAKENVMRNEMTARPRNGIRHGDVSYITLGLPDLARGRDFYAAVLGFRVDDIASAVESVRSHGGTISDPHPEPYALAAEGHDDQGTPFYLHQMPPEDAAPEVGATFHNGEVEGDVSYLTMVVPDLDAARAFYGGVFGWTFNIGLAGGAQVSGVAPQIGMTTRPEAGPMVSGVILCYRVDDVAAAVQRVGDAGGRAGPVVQRPYGLESLCADDQGTPFYLHQF